MMKTLFISVTLALVMGLSGCIPTIGTGADQKKMDQAAAVKKFSDRLDNLDVVLKGVAGNTVSESLLGKVSAVSSKLDKLGETASAALSLAAIVPGPQQPYIKYGKEILGGLLAFATGLAAWFQRRKAKYKKGLDTVLVAVDGIDGVGAKITKETIARGVSDIVNESYNEAVKSAKPTG